MRKDTITIEGIEIDTYSLNTVIVGSGAAGLNAADTLYGLGQKDIAIVTEGMNMGTSRNTGSDKQTYYKLTLAGDTPDSVREMARTLFGGGCMHGDIALVEAALSTRCFNKLVNIGVPFPHNRWGEYIGYKTDHDPRQRATSAGPLTSRYMTERLEAQVRQKNIPVFDRFLAIGILTYNTKAIGLITLDMNRLEEPCMGFTLFNCTNIIYATGGPAGMYLASVYPPSQTGAMGAAFEAGAAGVNLTESQYGIASLKFRWNLSGTYQQVIPRYISTDPDGSDEREFLDEYFQSQGRMLDAIFLKGYQWPFDPRKIEGGGSSLIDLLVYNETVIKGRRVFLDYTKNPGGGEMDFSLMGQEAYGYLEKSGALFGTPIDRLKKMNQPAIELYKSNGIDLEKEYLEIGVCAQHSNGGLAGDEWWQSNVKHLFPVGECNGTFGIYRPGGSALNSTQVGSLRAAQYIYFNYGDEPMKIGEFRDAAGKAVSRKLALAREFVGQQGEHKPDDGCSGVFELRRRAQERMTRHGAHIRSYTGVKEAIEQCVEDLTRLARRIRLNSIHELPDAFRNRDILITQFMYLNAIKAYMERGGGSRGSYIILDKDGRIPAPGLDTHLRFMAGGADLTDQVCEMEYVPEYSAADRPACIARWKPVRPIPDPDEWFENVWNEYREGNVFKY